MLLHNSITFSSFWKETLYPPISSRSPAPRKHSPPDNLFVNETLVYVATHPVWGSVKAKAQTQPPRPEGEAHAAFLACLALISFLSTILAALAAQVPWLLLEHIRPAPTPTLWLPSLLALQTFPWLPLSSTEVSAQMPPPQWSPPTSLPP